MKIWQKLAKHENQLQKSPPRQNFQDLGLILGSAGELKITKIDKKPRRKNTKKIEGKKPQKILKKGAGTIGPAECAGRWGGYGGGKKISKTAKNNAKS